MTDLAVAGYLGKRRTRMQWSQVMKEFSGSGLKVSRYCAQVGISEASFYRWRSLLGKGSVGAARKSGGKAMPQTQTKDFIDLGPLDRMPMHASAAVDARVHVRLELGGGMVLTVSRG